MKSRQELMKFLSSVSLFVELSTEEKEKLTDCFNKEIQTDDQKIINQGDIGNKF